MLKKAPLTECPLCNFTAEKRAELTALLDREHAVHTLGGSDGGSPRRLAPEARDRRITLGMEAAWWNACIEVNDLHLYLLAEAARNPEDADEAPDEAEVQAADAGTDGADAASEAGGQVKKVRGRKAPVREPVAARPARKPRKKKEDGAGDVAPEDASGNVPEPAALEPVHEESSG